MVSRQWLREIAFVARKELLTLRRSRAVLFGSVVFSLAIAISVLLTDEPDAAIDFASLIGVNQGVDTIEPTAMVIYGLGRELPLLLAFLTVGCCCGTLAGEHERETMRTLQSFPVSRSAVVCGKLVGRALLVGVIVIIGLVTGAVTTVIRFGTLSIGPYALFIGVSLLFALVVTAMTVSVSALVATRLRAIAFTLGPLLLFVVFGTDYGVPPPVRSVLLVQPYHILVADVHDHLFAVPRYESVLAAGGLEAVDVESVDDLSAATPVYLSAFGAIASLFAWIVVWLPIAIQHHRRRDLS